MTLTELSLATLALLLTPGPTNTLLFLAGAERGPRALRLIPAELAGYLTTVLPLTLAGAALVQDAPGVQAVIALLAGAWVAVLAARLWRGAADRATAPTVTARAVFLTTALNPKAIIFGLVLLPAPQGVGLNLALFSALVAAVAALWATAGHLLTARRRPATGPDWLRRAASVWLAGLSVLLLLRGIGAA